MEIKDIDKVIKMSWCKKNKPILYKEINTKTENIKGTWGNKLFIYINNIEYAPICECNSPLKFISFKAGYREFCSRKCMYISDDVKLKRINTNINRYGVDNVSKSKIIRDKVESTNMSLFGAKYPLASKEKYKEYKESLLDKYGVDNVSKIEEVVVKRNDTIKNKYGVDSYPQHPDFINKSKKTKNDRYGDEDFNNRDKYINTMLNKYGVDNPLKIDDIKDKVSSTNLERYGEKSFTQTSVYKDNMYAKLITDNEIYFNDYNYELIEYINSDRVVLKCIECKKDFETTKQLFRKRIITNEEPCINCNPITNSHSVPEKELMDFIDSLGTEYIENDRKILNGREIDILIPSKNIGIEFNGLYWHSELHKDRDYHYTKMKDLEYLGIQLIQVWEDQWLYKKDIVKSIIKSKLGLIHKDNRIYARKCEIRNVSSSVSRKFLDENHIQGNVNSPIRYGLYYNDKLVSLMTFGKLRKNLGQKSEDGKFELLRFCNLLNTSVTGGFSKLLKVFNSDNFSTSIISYAMCDYSTNISSVYEKCGFKFEHYTKQNFFYVKDKIRYNRFKFRKDVLVKDGYDKNKTSGDIMLERKYYRIYDSGSIKYSFSSPI